MCKGYKLPHDVSLSIWAEVTSSFLLFCKCLWMSWNISYYGKRHDDYLHQPKELQWKLLSLVFYVPGNNMEVKRNSTFSSEIQQQHQNTNAMAMGNAVNCKYPTSGSLSMKKVRRTLGSKDCNLAKKRRLMDCSWANSLNSLREVGISIAWLISSSVQNGAKDLHGSKCAFSPRTRKGIPNDQSLWGDSEWRTPKARWVKSLTFVPKAEECTIYRKTPHLQRRIQIIFIMS